MVRTLRTATRSRRERAQRHFLSYYPRGFRDADYLELEREPALGARRAWEAQLDRAEYERLLGAKDYVELAARAVRVVSGTGLLATFDELALRDATRPPAGAHAFAVGLHAHLWGEGPLEVRFEAFADVLASLPRRRARALSWPLQTVWAAVARPRQDLVLEPETVRRAAEAYGFDLFFEARPAWRTYESLLAFAAAVRADLAETLDRALQPRDLVDVQGFLRVLGSVEYP